MGTFTNSIDPDEMLHIAAFHQATLIVKVKKIFRQNTKIFYEYYNLTPLDVNNGLSQVYCIISGGNTKG